MQSETQATQSETQTGGEAVLDRWSELANIGTGHAAGALASMVGQTIRMRVPQVVHRGDRDAELPVDPAIGIVFGVEGGIGGHFAVFMTREWTDSLLRVLLGHEVSLESTEAPSALCEIGNVMASHALSALADQLGTTVLPSLPELTLVAPATAFETRFGARSPRIENLLVDDRGGVLGVLVWLPET